MSRDPEKQREASRRWRAANPEKVLAADRAHYWADPEKARERTRQWQAANPERRRENDRRWRQANPERRRENDRRRRAANPEKRRENARRYRASWPDLRLAHDWTPEGWWAQWHAQRGRCYLCDEPLPADRRLIAIDHDHGHCPPGRSCARCRLGLAHMWCNTIVGQAGDDAAKLARIARNRARAERRAASRPPPGPAPQLALFTPPELMPPAPQRPRNGARRPPAAAQLTLFDPQEVTRG